MTILVIFCIGSYYGTLKKISSFHSYEVLVFLLLQYTKLVLNINTILIIVECFILINHEESVELFILLKLLTFYILYNVS